MKIKAILPMVAVAGFFVLASAQSAQAFEILDRYFRGRSHGCCDVEPTCCAPEVNHCAPEPVCCEPEPTCCDADPCGRCHRRPLRDLLHRLFHHHRHGCGDCCDVEPSCCEPEPSCCGY